MIIPALNEALNISGVLDLLNTFGLRQIIVADNGSTDGTADAARVGGATVVAEPRRGYGAACYTGMQQLDDDIEVVVFLDADLSDDPTLLLELVGPILDGHFDLMVGARVASLRERGSMTLAQRFGNGLAVTLIRWGWGFSYTDLGPFRAIRRQSLDAINMQDRAFGWTIEMQIRAIELGIRIGEMPVPYRCRADHTPSKISGTIRGSLKAGYWILSTCGKLWWSSKRRKRESSQPAG